MEETVDEAAMNSHYAGTFGNQLRSCYETQQLYERTRIPTLRYCGKQSVAKCKSVQEEYYRSYQDDES